MRIFATDQIVAKSRFWYFLRQLRKFKKTTGEIVSVEEIRERKPLKIKLRNLVEVRLQVWDSQHVPRVQGPHCLCCHHPVLQGHGSQAQSPGTRYSDYQVRGCRGWKVPPPSGHPDAR